MAERVLPVRRLDDVFEKTGAAIETKRREAVRRRPVDEGYIVGAADDRAEREADKVAEQGMAALRSDAGSASADLHRISTPGAGGSRIRRSPAPASSAVSIGASGGETDSSLSSDIDIARGGGRTLEPGVQADVQRAIGHDVSDVTIHTDARADGIAQRIQASAFTIGKDIFFAHGQYQPETTGGMHTLLHESAHAMDTSDGVQRRSIRRLLSVTPEEFDGTFKKSTGMAGMMKSLTSDEIPKIREALKAYHANVEGDPKRTAALQTLIKQTDVWLRKHPAPKSPEERSRVDFLDSIRTQVSMEYAKAQAGAIYMQAGTAAAVAGGQVKAGKVEGRINQGGAPVKPLGNLLHPEAFANLGQADYDDRGDITQGRNSTARSARKGQGLGAVDPETEAALSEAMKSLSPAEFAAIQTYTGNDYSYINKNIGGYGKGDFQDEAEGKANQQQYEEAGLHAGFIGEAFRKLPVWKGNTFRGMAMDEDFLGLTTDGQYKANDYWSSSESIKQAQGFVTVSAKGTSKIATLCRITVTNGRDVARMSNSPDEVEILLPPGSIYKVGARRCLTRGVDDREILAEFGNDVFTGAKTASIKEFWVIDITQQFSNEKDIVGAYPSEPGKKPAQKPAGKGAGWKSGDANQTVVDLSKPYLNAGASRARGRR